MDRSIAPEFRKACRRREIRRRAGRYQLRRRRVSLGALCLEDRRLLVGDAEVLEELRQFWAPVFQAWQMSRHAVEVLFHCSQLADLPLDWQLTMAALHSVADVSRESAPVATYRR